MKFSELLEVKTIYQISKETRLNRGLIHAQYWSLGFSKNVIVRLCETYPQLDPVDLLHHNPIEKL